MMMSGQALSDISSRTLWGRDDLTAYMTGLSLTFDMLVYRLHRLQHVTISVRITNESLYAREKLSTRNRFYSGFEIIVLLLPQEHANPIRQSFLQTAQCNILEVIC